jgi:hypothetical protein
MNTSDMMSQLQLQVAPFTKSQNFNRQQEETYFLDDFSACGQPLMPTTSFWDEDVMDADYDSEAAIQCLDLMDILCNESPISLSEDLSEEEEEDEEIRLLCDAAAYTTYCNNPVSQFLVPRSRSPQIGNRAEPTKEEDNLIEEPTRVVRRFVTFRDEANNKDENISPAPSRSPMFMTMTPPPSIRRLPIFWSHSVHQEVSFMHSPVSVVAKTIENEFENTLSMLRKSAQTNMQAQEKVTAELASALSLLRFPNNIATSIFATTKHAGSESKTSAMPKKAEDVPSTAVVHTNNSMKEDLVRRWMRRASVAEGLQHIRQNIVMEVDEDIATICKAGSVDLIQKQRLSFKSARVRPTAASERVMMPRRRTIHVVMAE